MPYKVKEVELTMELVESFGFPTPPTEFIASPLFRGHSWNESEIGYELFRRVEYYGSLPTARFKPGPSKKCNMQDPVVEKIEEIVEAVTYVICDVDLGPIQDKYNAIQRTLHSLLKASGQYNDLKSMYFDDMKKLYNRHGELYLKSDPRRKISHRLENRDDGKDDTYGFNLHILVSSQMEGSKEDRSNEAIITYDKSMPGILPGNGMAKHYYNKYNDGLVELDSIPDEYRGLIINDINIEYEVVQ